MARRSNERKRDMRAARRRRLWWAAAVGMLLLFGWLVFANRLPVGQSQTSAEPAPELTLTTAHGEYRLSEQKGEVVALYFSFVG